MTNHIFTQPVSTTVILKMEQPPEGFNLEIVTDCGNAVFIGIMDGVVCNSRIKLPIRPGDRVGFRDSEWIRYQVVLNVRKPDGRSFDEIQDGEFAYKSDGYGTINELKAHIKIMIGTSCTDVITEFNDWQPASTMPEEAIRTWKTAVSVEVKQAQNVSYDSLRDAGYKIILDEYQCPVSTTLFQDFKTTDYVCIARLEE